MSGFWYLATPYSRHAGGIEAAWREACRQSALLIKVGVPVYSPIAHTHPIAIEGGMDPLDHTIWLPADQPMMEAAHGLIVCMMDGWRNSYGITVEIEAFKRRYNRRDRGVQTDGAANRLHAAGHCSGRGAD